LKFFETLIPQLSIKKIVSYALLVSHFGILINTNYRKPSSGNHIFLSLAFSKYRCAHFSFLIKAIKTCIHGDSPRILGSLADVRKKGGSFCGTKRLRWPSNLRRTLGFVENEDNYNYLFVKRIIRLFSDYQFRVQRTIWNFENFSADV
jgi:hypothetical protein